MRNRNPPTKSTGLSKAEPGKPPSPHLDSRKEGIQPFKVTAVPDTGCTASLISVKLAQDKNLIIRPTNSTLSLFIYLFIYLTFHITAIHWAICPPLVRGKAQYKGLAVSKFFRSRQKIKGRANQPSYVGLFFFSFFSRTHSCVEIFLNILLREKYKAGTQFKVLN